MPRGKQTKTIEEKENQPVPEIIQVPVEVPINLELINQKLNLINQKLNLVPEVKKALEQEEIAAREQTKT